MIMTYNILNHRVEMDARFMKMNTESRTRGHNMKLKISRSKIEIRRNFFTNRIKKKMEWSWCHATAQPRSIVDNLRLVGMFVCALLSHPILYRFFSKLT